MLITIITPSIGSIFFKEQLKSINQQYGLNHLFKIEHFICIDDAPNNYNKVKESLDDIPAVDGLERFIFNLPFSTGKNKYNGHKIYASISQLVNGDFTMFFDDDNTMDEYLIISYLRNIETCDWIYSLRKIINENNEFICNDECESLGYLSPVFYNNESHLIDTNCYFIKSNVLKNLSPIWNRPAQYNDNDPDRVFGSLLMTNFTNYKCLKEHLVNYRVSTNSKINHNLFINGNNRGFKYFIYKPILYIIHFNKDKTDEILKRIYEDRKDDVSFKNWQFNIMDNLKNDFYLKNAYTSKYIPSGSIVWTHMFEPSDLPSILNRKDLIKILYTIESPNIRHQEMWNKDFIFKYFNHVVTYWSDFLKYKNTYFYPFIHRINFNSLIEQENIIHNKSKYKSACILLENRSLHQSYKINDTILQAQDYKRKLMVKKINKYMPVFTYGASWADEFKNEKTIFNIITPSRFDDLDKTTDYYSKHTFTIIIENTNADGYVSEKIYDAWMAGSIPIYEGNFNDLLFDYFSDIPVKDMFIKSDNLEILNDDNKINEIKNNIENYRYKILQKVDVSNYNLMIKNLYINLSFKNYSQQNEDIYLYKYFKHIKDGEGVYLELGAMDGIIYSNTKYYEDKHKWKGILIEPHPVNFNRLKINRPNNFLFNELISNHENEVDFIYSDHQHTAVSGIVETIPQEHYEKYFNHIETKTVKLKPKKLKDLIKNTGFKKIDFFILDVEGHEKEVLETFDFKDVDVYLFMIEDLEDKGICRNIMAVNGYKFIERYGMNDIYMKVGEVGQVGL